MNPDRTPRQRLDTDARKESILHAAREVYAAHQYTDVSAAQVAQAAGASTALVFHYFGSKAGLYAAVVDSAIATLVAAQEAALAALPEGVSARDRIRASVLVYLDYVAAHPHTWAAPLTGGEEPREAIDVRRKARAAYVEALRDVLKPTAWARHEYALWGYFGFLDQACLRWVDGGCPHDDRHALVDAALGALEGALGDWGA